MRDTGGQTMWDRARTGDAIRKLAGARPIGASRRELTFTDGSTVETESLVEAVCSTEVIEAVLQDRNGSEQPCTADILDAAWRTTHFIYPMQLRFAERLHESSTAIHDHSLTSRVARSH